MNIYIPKIEFDGQPSKFLKSRKMITVQKHNKSVSVPR